MFLRGQTDDSVASMRHEVLTMVSPLDVEWQAALVSSKSVSGEMAIGKMFTC